MKTRGMAVALALLLAAAATGAVFAYVRNARQEAKTKTSTVTVIVSRVDIPVGTQLDTLLAQNAFTTRQFARDSLVQGVVTTQEQLRGQTAAFPILAGEQISVQRFQGSNQVQGGALGIPQGFVAITVSLDAPPNVAGNVAKGSHVTVFADVKGAIITLLPDVLVLSDTGTRPTSTTGSSGGASTASGLVTMALKPRDAQKLFLAQQSGTLWLALLPPGQKGQSLPPIKILVP